MMVWLREGEKTLMICLAVSTEYRRVTDGQTDGRTDTLPRHSPRYAYASRGKNTAKKFNCLSKGHPRHIAIPSVVCLSVSHRQTDDRRNCDDNSRTTKNHTTFKLTEDTHIMSNWQSNCKGGPHIVSELTCLKINCNNIKIMLFHDFWTSLLAQLLSNACMQRYIYDI